MLYLKQSTASQSVLIGPFLDDTDFITPETALTINAADIRLSKAGANIVGKNSGGATHDEAGWYQITLDATDTATVGTLQLHVDVAGALPVWHEYTVLEEDIYDSLFGASADAFDSSGRVSISGTINTLDQLATRVGTAQAGSSSSITLDAGASSTNNFYRGQTVVLLSGTGAGQQQIIASYDGATQVATVDGWSVVPDSSSVFALMPWGDANLVWWYYEVMNSVSGAGNVLADVGAISGDTAAAINLEALLDGTGGVTLSADLAGTINGLTAAALADFFDTDSGSSYGAAVAGSVVKETADNAGGSSLTLADIADAVWDEAQADHTTAGTTGESLDDASSGGSAPTAGEVADAVWDEAKSGHVGAGSFGEEVQSHALSSEITALNDVSAAEVNAEVDTALADYDGPTHAELVSEINDVQSDVAALNDPTAASIADAVWDESQAGHVAAGSFGEIATEIASILEDTGTTLDGKLDTIDGVVDAILVDTDTTIPGLIAALNDLSAAEVNAQVDTALADYDAPTKAELDSGLAALNDLSAADVNAEVLDVLNTDTFAEPGSVPAATASLVQKIGWLYILSRNEINQSSSQIAVRDDGDTADVATATVSDNGTTATRSEWS